MSEADNEDPTIELLKDIFPCSCTVTKVPGTELVRSEDGNDWVRRTCRECDGKLYVPHHAARLRNELRKTYDRGFKNGKEDTKVRTLPA